MMRWLTFFILLMATPSFAVTYYSDGFETGAATVGTRTVSGVGADADYSTAGLELVGSKCAKLVADAANYVQGEFASIPDEFYVLVAIRPSQQLVAISKEVVRLTSGVQPVAKLYLYNDGVTYISSSTPFFATTKVTDAYTPAYGSTRWFVIHYVEGDVDVGYIEVKTWLGYRWSDYTRIYGDFDATAYPIDKLTAYNNFGASDAGLLLYFDQIEVTDTDTTTSPFGDTLTDSIYFSDNGCSDSLGYDGCGLSSSDPIDWAQETFDGIAFDGGESVYFNKGDTFYCTPQVGGNCILAGTFEAGTSWVTGNYTLISSFGTGDMPIIDSSAKVDGFTWTDVGGGIYSYSYSNGTGAGDDWDENQVSNLWVDDVPMIDEESCVGSAGDVDAAGEWCLDTTNDVLYLYTPDGLSPSTHDVHLSRGGLISTGADYIKFDNLHLKHGARITPGSDYNWIYNNEFDRTGISIQASTGTIIEYNYVHDVWDGGLYGEQGSGGTAIGIGIGTDTRIIKNVVYNNYVGIVQGSGAGDSPGAVIAYNVLADQMVNNIDACYGSANCGGTAAKPITIANNTVFHNPTDGRPANPLGHALALRPDANYINYYNNISYIYVDDFIGWATTADNFFGDTDKSLNIADYNIYHAPDCDGSGGPNTINSGGVDYCDGDFATYQATVASVPRDVNSYAQDPLLVGVDFSTWSSTISSSAISSASSPAVDNALDLCSTLGTISDINGTLICNSGTKVVDSVDIGAFEYIASGGSIWSIFGVDAAKIFGVDAAKIHGN